MVPPAILEAIVDVAAADPEVRALYMFGSRSSGEARVDSDVDLAVLYRRPHPLGATLALAEHFERVVCRPVDLIDVARANAFLALDIVRGERIFCRDATAVDHFELYVLRRAGDLLPFERARQALLLDSAPR